MHARELRNNGIALLTALFLTAAWSASVRPALAAPGDPCIPGQDCNNDGLDDCTQPSIQLLHANTNPLAGDVGFEGPIAQDLQLDAIAILRDFTVFYTLKSMASPATVGTFYVRFYEGLPDYPVPTYPEGLIQHYSVAPPIEWVYPGEHAFFNYDVAAPIELPAHLWMEVEFIPKPDGRTFAMELRNGPPTTGQSSGQLHAPGGPIPGYMALAVSGVLCEPLPDCDGDELADAVDLDDDNDGVPDTADVCPRTIGAHTVDTEGRPLSDLDRNCVVDLHDFATFALDFGAGECPVP
ncbi:MAG: hypothetical protein JSU68_04740 [Phycisphaerales bacterium]|nr:MAG: hypothetical protein JSU68_04740 [Phycisphaerales bacterium]